MEQFEGRQVAEDARNLVDDGGILQVATGRGVRQEQVVPDQLHDDRAVVRVEAHACGQVRGNARADDAVIAATRLADVVEERTDEQQVWPGDVAGERAGLHRRLDQVSIDRVLVHGVALRSRADDVPPGDEAADHAVLVEGLPHTDHRRARAQQRHERLAHLARPRGGRVKGLGRQAVDGVRGHAQPGLRGGRGGSKQQSVVAGGLRLEGEHHLAVLHDDSVGKGQTRRGPTPDRSQGDAMTIAGEPVDAVPRHIARVGNGPRAVVHRTQERIRVGNADQVLGDGILLLHHQPVAARASDPLKRITNVEQESHGILVAVVGYVGHPGGCDALEDRGVAQSSVGLLEVRFEQLRGLAETLLAVEHHLAKCGKPSIGHRPPVGQDGALKLFGHRRVSGDDAGVEYAEDDLEIVAGQAPGLADRAHAVVKSLAGIPDRVPQGLGNP